MVPWRRYQLRAASLFREMGHKPHVDFNVAGVRAEHQIDVWVEFDYCGVRIRWIIECKAWRRRVTKEKVAALRAIADDVGADRAFLLSETGFQRGAIAAAFAALGAEALLFLPRRTTSRRVQTLSAD